MEVCKGVNVFYGKNFNCNTYVLEGKILVDPGLERPIQDFLDELASENITLNNIEKIVCTHCHYDHIGFLAQLKEETEAGVWAHALDADAISTGNSQLTAGFGLQPVKVDHLLKEDDMISNFKVLHTPGHTQGSICLYNQTSKSLLSGDTVFADGIGRTDLPGGNSLDMKASLERLSALEIEVLLPGHGPVVKENAKNSVQSGLSIVDFT